ncbi:MAG: hypothetical protein M1556_01230 [Candidatus Thermoplasmatota archaeon]|jgi:hypothetical protein|nr:hypothetical protein [Candidatus Thermoplasmatota archaeon]MCL6002257.1 hypothetical protein [Candidatus Thermoplasmatota archaeon]
MSEITNYLLEWKHKLENAEREYEIKRRVEEELMKSSPNDTVHIYKYILLSNYNVEASITKNLVDVVLMQQTLIESIEKSCCQKISLSEDEAKFVQSLKRTIEEQAEKLDEMQELPGYT